ncbi:M14 family zinc carboxypeptidase [Pseudokineococcus sp. 1T1Z-3]|uniref:M14 family zinc carboxypeptidase n=1 Tax=Pseudokineococcus sp. 1T1Z-3 TaxID=3132745 RepID=UPI0030A72CBB
MHPKVCRRTGLGAVAVAVALSCAPGAAAATESRERTSRSLEAPASADAFLRAGLPAATPEAPARRASAAGAAGPLATPAPGATAGSALAAGPSSYPSQPRLRVYPDEPADAAAARGALAYDEIAPRVQALMDRSAYVSAEVVGTSTLGREQLLVTLTAPETPTETAQQTAWRQAMKDDAEAAAADEAFAAGYKVPLWFNNNIHGNEVEGTDASLAWMEDLVDRAEAGDAEALEVLATSRLYFTMSNNPDGRVAGARRTALDLDANRDHITNATPETRTTRALADRLQPLFFSDIHGYTRTLQVEPCGPPHGENYDYDLFLPHAYASALRIEADVAAADIPGNVYRAEDGSPTPENTGRFTIPYRDTPVGWDDWPPVFTAQYVAYQGAVTSTVELPRGTDVATNITIGRQVITSTTDYVLENRADMLANQVEIFRRGSAGEPLRTLGADPDPATVPGPDQWAELWGPEDVYRTDFPDAYVIRVGEDQRSATNAARLVDTLLAHGVEVGRVPGRHEVDGVTVAPGSYLVDMQQPMRGLANALLAPGSDISDRVPFMYDVSAWSLGELWGADVDTVQELPRTSRGRSLVRARPVTQARGTASVPRGSDLRLALTGPAEVRALNRLLADEVPVGVLPDGSVVLDQSRRAAAAAVSRAEGVAFTEADDVTPGEDGVPLARPLRVAYTTSSSVPLGGDDLLSLEALGYEDPLRVSAATLASGEASLEDVDVLWVGAGLSRGPLPAEALAELEAFAAAGGDLVGRGTAATALAQQLGYVDATAVAGNGWGNGLLAVETPAGGLLDGVAEDHAFGYAPVHFTDLGEGDVVEQTYGDDPLVAGHWTPLDAAGVGGPAAAAGQPSVISGESEAGGRAVLFGTYPTFRAHPVGMLDDLARALGVAQG